MRDILKYFLIICFVFTTTGIVFAKDKMPVIKFNKAKYTLYYSSRSNETGAYSNEYYKKYQTYTTWDELLALHDYSKDYSPIDKAREYSAYLAKSGIVSTVNEYEDNRVIMDFVIEKSNQYPILLEYNILEFVKGPVCGTVALQYAKRYRVKNGIEAEKVKKNLFKKRDKLIKKVYKLEVPKIVKENIDKGEIIVNEGIDESRYVDFK